MTARQTKALLRTAKACGSGTRGWCQAGGDLPGPTGLRGIVNSPAMEARGIRLQGERVISRKTIAQGRPDAPADTCMLVCVFLRLLHTRPRVPASTRPSLRPLILWGRKFLANLGRIASRDREVMFAMTTGREGFLLPSPGGGGSARMSAAICETGWGDLSTRALLDVERPSPRPAARFARVDPPPPGEGKVALTTPVHSRTQTSSPAACSHPKSASA